MRSEIIPIFLCILLISNISSGLIYLFSVRSMYELSKYLQIPYVYADIIDNSSSTSDGSPMSSQILSDSIGQEPPPGPPCDPLDPSCATGQPPGEEPPPGPPCDPLDPSCATGQPPIEPSPEKCFDDIDNNGDGQIDDGCPVWWSTSLNGPSR